MDLVARMNKRDEFMGEWRTIIPLNDEDIRSLEKSF